MSFLGDRNARLISSNLGQEFHALRKYRNSLLHSAFVELKAGDDVVGLVRSHPYIYVYTDTGELVVDEEAFTSESVILHAAMSETSLNCWKLSDISVFS